MSPRKKLNENEAEFIKGTSASPQSSAKPKAKQPAKPATKTTRKPSAKRKPKPSTTEDIVSQILSPAVPAPKIPTIRFTADLPEELHRRLSVAAAKAGKSKVDIVRELLEAVLPNDT